MSFLLEILGSLIWDVAIKDNPKAKNAVNNVVKYGNDQNRKAVNEAQRKLNSYSSRYDELPEEGKAKYNKLQSQINRAQKKCDANEKVYNKMQRK